MSGLSSTDSEPLFSLYEVFSVHLTFYLCDMYLFNPSVFVALFTSQLLGAKYMRQ